jgi:hypothetical protein
MSSEFSARDTARSFPMSELPRTCVYGGLARPRRGHFRVADDMTEAIGKHYGVLRDLLVAGVQIHSCTKHRSDLVRDLTDLPAPQR